LSKEKGEPLPVYVNVFQDFSHDEKGRQLSIKKFWKKMSKQAMVRLVDERGQMREPTDLPKQVLDLHKVIKIRIADLHPTQFAVGEEEVRRRLPKLREREKAGTLDTYLRQKAPEAVIGPNGKIYLIDGHHLARMRAEMGAQDGTDPEMYVTIVADLSTKENAKPRTLASFWKKMIKAKWVYLKDKDGKERTVSELPQNIPALGNDPYRALVWLYKQTKGFRKTGVSFEEFAWADFFREHVDPPPQEGDEQGWNTTLTVAVQKVHAAWESRDLPGPINHRALCAWSYERIGASVVIPAE
jgi:hypothetical protein